MSSENQTERREEITKNSVVFFIFDGENIQLEKRIRRKDRYYGYVLIPGGKCEGGESPQTALAREIREEYGISYIQGEELGLVVVSEDDGTTSCKHLYLINYWKGRIQNPEKKDIHLSATLDEARSLCKHPVSQIFLDLLEKRLLRQNGQRI